MAEAGVMAELIAAEVGGRAGCSAVAEVLGLATVFMVDPLWPSVQDVEAEGAAAVWYCAATVRAREARMARDFIVGVGGVVASVVGSLVGWWVGRD